MTTPQSHIDQMREIAQHIEDNNDFVSCAEIDDWGYFSNFYLIVSVTEKPWPRSTTNKIKGAVNRAIRELGNKEVHVRDYFPQNPSGAGTTHLLKMSLSDTMMMSGSLILTT